MGKINGVDISIITKLNGKNLVDITNVKGKSTELIPSWPRRPPPGCSPTLLRGPAPSDRIVCELEYITYDFNISSELIFLEGYCGNSNLTSEFLVLKLFSNFQLFLFYHRELN